ncbi:DUF3891 family protein [Metabacillus halosaccharovorans]|uniref:DUF3891 family protein n=1 Tax=Metabacillus halosaccharovorans TaxID=930124 RepID=UPI00203A9CC8|nr:DUF3891 family protein [Metabacillus halosaccharovorans]MCM3443810.1 DUF3891 family protein [Metabacillus halosaccharovorans]
MIINERESEFVIIEQHNHAVLSGDLFSYLQEEFFTGKELKQDILYATQYHDCAWIGLDAAPLWDDKKNSPYSFINLPSSLKLPHYRYGIDWIEQRNKYAALLCSRHYSSFFSNSKSEDEIKYLQYEKTRQKRLCLELGIAIEDSNIHLEILKFLDNLSIYICINEPGVPKSDEFPWYQNGFEGTELFSVEKSDRIVAYWLNEGYIGLTPFPFTRAFEVTMPTKIVGKCDIKEKGIIEAYKDVPAVFRTFKIGPMGSTS